MTEDASQTSQSEVQPQKPSHKHSVKKVRTYKSGLKFSLSSFMLIILCSFLLVISTFVQLNITHFGWSEKFFSADVKDYVQTFSLIPQVPAVMFVAGLLGRKFGLASVLIYLLTGLFILPVFALGGGWQYIGEYGFGYLLAYIPAVFFTGTILKEGFTYKNSIKAVMVGVLTIHAIGILYMLAIAAFRHEGWSFITGWIMAQSGVKIIYDFIFSLLSVLVAKYLRLILWLYM